MRQRPSARATIFQAGDAAGIEVKRPIAVEVSSRNSAGDSDDREVMANHSDPRVLAVARDDFMQRVPGPLRDVDQALAAWDAQIRRFAAPAG